MPVTAEVKSFETHSETGNILINIEYTLPDDSKVINPYHARYENFIGKTQAEIDKFILNQMEEQCDRYLEEYSTKANVNDTLMADYLNNTIGTTITKDKIKRYRTNKNRLVTPYLNQENYIKILTEDEIVVKEIEIDEDGVIVEKAPSSSSSSAKS